MHQRLLKESLFPECWKVLSVFNIIVERLGTRSCQFITFFSVVSSAFVMVMKWPVEFPEKCGSFLLSLFSVLQYV